MSELQPTGDEGSVAIFAIPDEKASSTLEAIEAMNRAGGGDLLTVKDVSTGGAATLSGTHCSASDPGVPGQSDFICTDTDT
jgi:hypothetical protein